MFLALANVKAELNDDSRPSLAGESVSAFGATAAPLARRETVPEAPAPKAPAKERFSTADLEKAVRSANENVLFAPVRILRRVIKEHREIAGPGFNLPHLHCYVIERRRLFQIVDPDELGLASAEEAPGQVRLLLRPDWESLEAISPEEALERYWRLAFHAAIHAAMEPRFSLDALDKPRLRQAIAALGQTEFAEIKSVLENESLLLPPGDEATTFVEFAATYLELRHFTPSFVERYFPGLADVAEVDRLLAEFVDAARLIRETRPIGAERPAAYPESAELEFGGDESDGEPARQPRIFGSRRPSSATHGKLVERAERSAARGNLVRSAIAWTRARGVAPPEARTRARHAATLQLDRLIQRLEQALNLPAEDRDRWREPLLVLVAYAADGGWTTEARLLYDLQKICVESERNVFRTDLVGWALSWGKNPLMRPLPRLREVLMCRHLQRAARRLSAARLSIEHRRILSALLEDAAARAERALRDRFRPTIHAVLRSHGLSPENLPERVALQKLVEELLDGIVRRGYLTMGDLRDALARNNLKLRDFSGFGDLLRGDPLLRSDKRLAIELEGVHKRGEFYLRWMQILSSLAFGTKIGRFLTRFVAVPFGGAYLAVAGVHHLIIKFKQQAESAPTEAGTGAIVLVLGFFLMGVLNVEWFRLGIWGLLKSGWRLAKKVVVEWPKAVLSLEWVQRVLRSAWFRLGYRFVVKPLAVTFLLGLVADLAATGWRPKAPHVAAMFLAVNLLLNSRIGRNLEEVALEGLLALWRRIGFQVLARVFWFVMDLFRAAVDGVERLLYTVDEWLRFRSGESRLKLALKAILNPVWLVLSYLARFCITLLIEPQINPIKHFPVVTVSHKLLLPLIPALAAVLDVTMEKSFAFTVATIIIAAIPGAFGFLVWELRENWRLYKANRAPRLRPAAVGNHGETFSRLLRPGFHSGTIPKRFTKLRRAEQAAQKKKRWSGVRKHLRGLAEMEREIRDYLQRDVLQSLNETPAWRGDPIRVGRVLLATNRIRVELLTRNAAASADAACAWLAFDWQANWLIASLTGERWLASLTTPQRTLLEAAIGGAYQIAGADVNRQEIERQLPSAIADYYFDPKALLVWPDKSFAGEARYALRGDEALPDDYAWRNEAKPVSDMVKPEGDSFRIDLDVLPKLDRRRLLLSNHPIAWDEWVAFWERAAAPSITRAAFVRDLQLLPSN